MRLSSIVLAAILIATVAASPDPLAADRWRHRVLLVFAAPDDAALSRQRAELAADPAGLAERDVQVIEIVDESAPRGMHAAQWRETFNANTERFLAILIGKDGGEKLRQSTPISTRLLFSVIDAMPMRRREIGRGG